MKRFVLVAALLASGVARADGEMGSLTASVAGAYRTDGVSLLSVGAELYLQLGHRAFDESKAGAGNMGRYYGLVLSYTGLLLNPVNDVTAESFDVAARATEMPAHELSLRPLLPFGWATAPRDEWPDAEHPDRMRWVSTYHPLLSGLVRFAASGQRAFGGMVGLSRSQGDLVIGLEVGGVFGTDDSQLLKGEIWVNKTVADKLYVGGHADVLAYGDSIALRGLAWLRYHFSDCNNCSVGALGLTLSYGGRVAGGVAPLGVATLEEDPIEGFTIRASLSFTLWLFG
jgi:hypothetical protein